MIDPHQLSVVAIGNGTACREAEEFIAELIGNRVGGPAAWPTSSSTRPGPASIPPAAWAARNFPSTTPRCAARFPSAAACWIRLSELVKIDPANIGVGLYQHDVKAKHLGASLDEVVESCVNYVGVDVNTASPALLRYVSGMNQLTARRVYEHRRQNGPFRNREQLKEVPGFGEATFVQAAGFLKIAGGENPLDATWIHPESYEVAGACWRSSAMHGGRSGDKEKAPPWPKRSPRSTWSRWPKSWKWAC